MKFKVFVEHQCLFEIIAGEIIVTPQIKGGLLLHHRLGLGAGAPAQPDIWAGARVRKKRFKKDDTINNDMNT